MKLRTNLSAYNFQKLTPIKNADLSIYEAALDFVFQEDDLKNIAITGPYSAGKSSAIESYLHRRPDKHFLNISLAHFDSVKNEGEVSPPEIIETLKNTMNNDAAIEGKILNQLIHQINPQKIPQSHFKVKRKVSKRKIFRISSLFTISIILILYILNFKTWKNTMDSLSSNWLKSLLEFSTYDISFFLGGFCGVIILLIATYSIMKIQYNRNMFKKITVQGNEIEIFAEANESYFDKYLNEVLYLFENAGVEVIVFEDIDRFNSNHIFEKLREINLLINKKSDKIIRFFYLLRDDIFTSKDRTKFFDFMIPIVPVVDASNSYDQFITHFKKGNIFENFDESFLQGLSLYIDDMRMLKNIYNEYVIYHDRIQSTELNPNKLLAVITYKNIFPKDFSELQLGKGFIHNLFENKSSLIEVETNKISHDIQVRENQILNAENEICNKIDELDAIYFKMEMLGVIDVGGQYENQFNSRASFIRRMKNNPQQVYISRPNYSGRYQLDFETEYTKLELNTEYTDRKRKVENKSRINVIRSEISELSNKKILLESRKLSEIINKDNINEVFKVTFTNEIGENVSYNEVKSSPYFGLIKFLIRNAYIDETYSDYMTYFYENSLSRADKIFLRSVTDEIPKEYTYQLKNPSLVVSRLKSANYNQEEILNFDLLEYLLHNENENLNRFISQLKTKNRYVFVLQFWIADREKSSFIKSLNHLWPHVLKGVLNDNNFSEIQKANFILDALYYSLTRDLEEQNDENCLTVYLSEHNDFLNINEPDISTIIAKLKLLNVKFKQINYANANRSLFLAVYEEELYEINMYLIEVILKEIYNLPTVDDNYKHNSYTLIVSRPEEALVKYVKRNIEQYVELILEYCDSMITDDENAALEIINQEDIIPELIFTYIEYLQTTIEKLESVINKDYWPKLLLHKNIRYSEHNILQYYFYLENDFGEVLVDFINGNGVDLNFNYNEIKDEFGTSETASFFKKIIISESLSNEKYEMFIRDFKRHYNEFKFEGISDAKLQILMKYKVVRMNDFNLKFVRDNYSEQLIYFIILNIDIYINEVINDGNFEISELLSLLDKDINDDHKLNLMAYSTEPISVTGKQYSERLEYKILENNFNIIDLPYLVSGYDQKSASLRKKIKSISIQHFDQILRENYKVPYDLLIDIFESSEVGKSSKKRLLVSHIIYLNEIQTTSCLQLLDLTDVISLFSGRRPKIERNNENEKILEIFKTKGWITSFNIDRQDNNYFRAIGRRAYI